MLSVSRFRQALKLMLAGVAMRLLPAVRARMVNGEPSAGLVDRLVRAGVTYDASKREDWNVLRKQFAGYWQGDQGVEFYGAHPDRFEKWFLGAHKDVVDRFEAVCNLYPDQFEELYEVGCGDGQVLHYMSKRFPIFQQYIGIDINSNIINRNRKKQEYSGLTFEDAEPAQWLHQFGRPGCVLMTYGGVLEYFTQAEVEDLIETVATLSPVAILIVEPIGDDYNTDSEITSRTYGSEHSFSHNYQYLLEQHNFKIEFSAQCNIDNRWQMLIATLPA